MTPIIHGVTGITSTTIEPQPRWRSRIRGAAVLLAVFTLVLAGCRTDADTGPDADTERGTRVGAEDVYPGELHECAGNWPLPDEVDLLETARGWDDVGERTCVVSLETSRPVIEMTDVYLASLEEDGWDVELRQRAEDAGMVALNGPLCGVMIVLPDQGSTSVMVSFMDCERVPEQPPPPGGG